jgi:hypothetical protein
MPNFSSFIAKIKKRTIILFSFLFAFLLFVPRVTHAIFGIDGAVTNIRNFFLWLILTVPAIAVNKISLIFCNISNALFRLVVSKLIVNPAETGFPNGKWVITQGIFLDGWNSVKNLANMLIVLAVVGIALATILRFRDYEAKKLLLPIIIVAVLINFSNVFVGIVIDASNFTMKGLLPPNTSEEENGLIDKIRAVEIPNTNYEIGGGTTDGNISGVIANTVKILEFAGIYFMLGAIFIYITLLLIARYVILGILFIFSPIAFVFRVFPLPDAKKLWNSWWEHFIKWCFIGVGLSFVLWLSYQMVTYVGLAQNQTTPNQSTLEFDLAIIVILLFVGIKITTKSSAAGANAIIGLGAAALTGGAGLAVGMAKRAGSLTAGAAGSTAPGAWVKEKATAAYDNTAHWLTRAGEKAGVSKEGTANYNYQKKVEARMKPYESLAEAEKNSGVIADRAMNSNNADERAAYIQVLDKRKKLDRILPGKRQQAINDAKSHNIDYTQWAEKNYQYGEFKDVNEKNIERTATNLGLPETHPDVISTARRQQLEENLSSMSAEQRRNIEPGDIKKELVMSESFTPGIAKNFKTADAARKTALRGTLPDISTEITTQRGALPKGATSSREIERLERIHAAIDKATI